MVEQLRDFCQVDTNQGQLCQSYVSLAQAKVIWEEGLPTEQIPP